MKKIAVILAVCVLGSSMAWAGHHGCHDCHHHCHHRDYYYGSDFMDALALIALFAVGACVVEQLQTAQQPTATTERTITPLPPQRQTSENRTSLAPVYAPSTSASNVRNNEWAQPVQPVQPIRFPVIRYYNFGN